MIAYDIYFLVAKYFFQHGGHPDFCKHSFVSFGGSHKQVYVSTSFAVVCPGAEKIYLYGRAVYLLGYIQYCFYFFSG